MTYEATRERLETYFDRPADALLWRRYLAMKAASALRETLWSMVSELYSRVDMDFAVSALGQRRWQAIFHFLVRETPLVAVLDAY